MGWVRSKVEEGGRWMDKYFLPCGQLRRRMISIYRSKDTHTVDVSNLHTV